MTKEEETPPAAEPTTEQDLAANNIIKNHVIAAGGVALVPIPIFDMAALTATQMSLLRSLSEHYEVPFDDTTVKSILTPILGGCLPVLSVIGLSSLSKMIPGIGTLAGSAGLSVTVGASTYAFGQVFAKHCAGGGNLQDFDSQQARRLIKEEFEHGKAFVRSIQDELRHKDNTQVAKQTDANIAEV
jgi:uncharacterized protein (DUF697 family)